MPDGHGCYTQTTHSGGSATTNRRDGAASSHARRAAGIGGAPDIWVSARSGSVAELEAALVALKKNNGNVNARNAFGVTALHLAVWRNHVPVIRRLLEAGADVNARDGESGWSSLHRALHFGHLAAAGVLIDAGASLNLEDSKGRTPVDLVSIPLKDTSSGSISSGSLVTEVYSWGSGVNYQLGTGTAGIQHIPCRVDSLQGLKVSNVAAAKFHSAAVTSSGELYSWGFGRGGRLGFSDFHIHSGQTAVITPERVWAGLGAQRVVAVATAKHHTIAATEGGEAYTWGSNREGRLGYPSVDTQPTPRRVSALRAKVVAVAAANKHSIVVTDAGEIFTWGCNRQGQLGYGTSNSASNCVPRCVEFHASAKGRQTVAVAAAAAKYHSVVLSAEGEVFTWGYKMVIPKRVIVARDTRKGGGVPLKFHRADKLHVSAIAAGVNHSTAITRDGSVFYWASNDPSCVRQISPLAGHEIVAVAAGKHRSAVTTALGVVYVWDAATSDVVPSPVRIPGLRHAVDLTVGESHSVAIANLFVPTYKSTLSQKQPKEGVAAIGLDGQDELDCDVGDIDTEDGTEERLSPSRKMSDDNVSTGVASLKELCEEAIATSMVDLKNVLYMLEVADSLGAENLKHYCQTLVKKNLDYILSFSASAWGQIRLATLADLQMALAADSLGKWPNLCMPKPTGVPLSSVVLEDDNDLGSERRWEWTPSTDRGSPIGAAASLDRSGAEAPLRKVPSPGFLLQGDGDQPCSIARQSRAVRRKLQQIEALELQQAKGTLLDVQQLDKLSKKNSLLAALDCLEAGVDLIEAGIILGSGSIRTDLPNGGLGDDLHQEDGLVLSQNQTQANKKNKHRSRRKGKVSSPGDAIYSDYQWSQTSKQGPVSGISQGDVGRWGDNEEIVKKLDFEVASEHLDPSKPACSEISGGLIGVGALGAISTRSDGERMPYHRDDASSSSCYTGQLLNELANQSSSSPLTFAAKPVKAIKSVIRKGGLSLFLTGALEASLPAPPPPPPTPRSEGPAWGGVAMASASKGASLRNIQMEQGRGDMHYSRATQGVVIGPQTGKDDSNRVALSAFLQKKSSPIAMRGAGSRKPSAGSGKGKKGGGAAGDETPTPWGRSPVGGFAPSLRDIQNQQEKKAQRRASGRDVIVGSPAALYSATSPGSLQKDPLPVNRWYRPEEEHMAVSSIGNIQIEEAAMKELRRKYSTVRLVTEKTR